MHLRPVVKATRAVSGILRTGGDRVRSWWQRGGSERCDFCTHAYVYEMEYRCVACDRGVCPCCVVLRARDLVFCPECDD